jgi:hypothetical protein
MSVEGTRGQWGREQACLCAYVCLCVCVCVCVFGVHVPHCTPHWRGLCRRGARPVWRNKNKKSPRPQACRIDYARTHKWRLRLRADGGCLRHCSEWNQPRASTRTHLIRTRRPLSQPQCSEPVHPSIFSPAAASHPPRPAPHMRELMRVSGKCTRETERNHRRAGPMRCAAASRLLHTSSHTQAGGREARKHELYLGLRGPEAFCPCCASPAGPLARRTAGSSSCRSLTRSHALSLRLSWYRARARALALLLFPLRHIQYLEQGFQ